VFSRYVLNKPHAWVLDAQIMLYGTLFMMAGAYTLSKNGHVRGDVLYGFFRPRTQATHRPGAVHRVLPARHRGADLGRLELRQDSLAIREQTFNADPLPVYPFKFVIPIAGACCCCRAWSRSCAA
jgi:TRAP-type mannitol/chloroaromatic compound transport system permease small subunit